MDTKKWYLSRTLWVNFLAAIALIVQAITGTEWFNLEVQGAFLVIVNMILRVITKQPVGK